MSLKEDFQDKMARFGLSANWFEHPAKVIARIDAEIDAVTNLDEAKALLKKLNKYYAAALWFLLQVTVEGR